MTNNPFNTTTTTTTTPSLGAIDLANMMGAGLVVGFGGLETEPRPKARRSFKGLLRKLAALRPGARNTP